MLWRILCRIFGHRPESVFDTGDWNYLECSRCGDRSTVRSTISATPVGHQPDAGWLVNEPLALTETVDEASLARRQEATAARG